MQVFNLVAQIPNHIDHACQLFIVKGEETRQRITAYAREKIAEANQTDFWQHTVSPIYKRNIEPLTSFDYLILTGSIASAILLTKIAIDIFTIAALPLAAGAGTLLIMGACHLVRSQIDTHLNEKAWESINAMRLSAQAFQPATYQDFQTLTLHRNELNRPEFIHLDNEMKQLDTELNKFREAFLAPHIQDKEDLKQVFITYLEGLQRKIAPHLKRVS